jgi:hypothetical protein
LSSRHRTHDPHPVVHGSASAVVAAAYNQSGADYIAYADGDPTDLFAFSGMHAYADRRIWALLEAKLTELRATGASSIGILDAGCGPGTWLRRLVVRAHELGFTMISRSTLRTLSANCLKATPRWIQHRSDVKHGRNGRDDHGGGVREGLRSQERRAGSEARPRQRPTAAFG